MPPYDIGPTRQCRNVTIRQHHSTAVSSVVVCYVQLQVTCEIQIGVRLGHSVRWPASNSRSTAGCCTCGWTGCAITLDSDASCVVRRRCRSPRAGVWWTIVFLNQGSIGVVQNWSIGVSRYHRVMGLEYGSSRAHHLRNVVDAASDILPVARCCDIATSRYEFYGT